MRSLLLLLVLIAASCTGAPSEPRPNWPGENTIVTSDGRLWVHVAGDPNASEVLVAVHGGPGLASDYLQDLDALAESSSAATRLCVARYDQRGCGESRSGFEDADHDMDAQIEDLLAVCDAVSGDRPVHLLGHSWGGLVAAVFASEYPERVRTLTLVGCMPADGRTSTEADVRMAAHLVDLERRGVIPRARVFLVDAAAFRSLLPAYFHDPAFAMPETLRQASFEPRTYGATLRDLGRDYDFRDRVRDVRCRTLVVHGESDPFGTEMSRAVAESLRGAEVEWFDLPRCGHFWQESPEPFYERLREFLDG